MERYKLVNVAIIAALGAGACAPVVVDTKDSSCNPKSPASETIPYFSNFEAAGSVLGEGVHFSGGMTSVELRNFYDTKIVPAVNCSPRYSDSIKAAGANLSLIQIPLEDEAGRQQSSFMLMNIGADGETHPFTIKTDSGNAYQIPAFFYTAADGGYFTPNGIGAEGQVGELLPLGIVQSEANPDVYYVTFGREVKVDGKTVFESPASGEYLIKVDTINGTTTYHDPYSGEEVVWTIEDQVPNEIRGIIRARAAFSTIATQTPGVDIPGIGHITPTIPVTPTEIPKPTATSTSEATAEPEFKIKKITSLTELESTTVVTMDDIKSGRVAEAVLNDPIVKGIIITKNPSNIDFRHSDSFGGMLSYTPKVTDNINAAIKNTYFYSVVTINAEQINPEFKGKEKLYLALLIVEDAKQQRALLPCLMGLGGITEMNKVGMFSNPRNPTLVPSVDLGARSDDYFIVGQPDKEGDFRALVKDKNFYPNQGISILEINDLFERISETDSFSPSDKLIIERTIWKCIIRVGAVTD